MRKSSALKLLTTKYSMLTQKALCFKNLVSECARDLDKMYETQIKGEQPPKSKHQNNVQRHDFY